MSRIPLSLQISDFDGHMDWDGGWSVVMVVGMVLFWVVLVAGVAWVVRELARGRSTEAHKADNEALRTLDHRLADGSISPEDYRERRALLTGKTQPEP